METMYKICGQVNDVGGSPIILSGTPRNEEEATKVALNTAWNTVPELTDIYLVEVDAEGNSIINDGRYSIVDLI